MKKILIYSIFGITLFALGFITSSTLYNNQPDKTLEFRNPGNYKFINPLLSCETPFTNQDTNISLVKHKVEEIIAQQTDKKQISFASVYYRDMNNGPWFGIQEKELFSPASLVKVPLMMTYFKKSQIDPNILSQKIINNLPHDPSQNIIPSLTLTPQKEYTVSELIDSMIRYSDNDAYYLLYQNLSETETLQIYHDLGIDLSTSNNPDGNVISVKNYASFFRILFNASYLSPELSEKSLETLSHSEYSKGLVNGLPKNITVAHKFGERQYAETGEKQLHDCGIVYLPHKPYLICVMTRGRDFDKMSRTIQLISTEIYNHLSQK